MNSSTSSASDPAASTSESKDERRPSGRRRSRSRKRRMGRSVKYALTALGVCLGTLVLVYLALKLMDSGLNFSFLRE